MSQHPEQTDAARLQCKRLLSAAAQRRYQARKRAGTTGARPAPKLTLEEAIDEVLFEMKADRIAALPPSLLIRNASPRTRELYEVVSEAVPHHARWCRVFIELLALNLAAYEATHREHCLRMIKRYTRELWWPKRFPGDPLTLLTRRPASEVRDELRLELRSDLTLLRKDMT